MRDIAVPRMISMDRALDSRCLWKRRDDGSWISRDSPATRTILPWRSSVLGGHRYGPGVETSAPLLAVPSMYGSTHGRSSRPVSAHTHQPTTPAEAGRGVDDGTTTDDPGATTGPRGVDRRAPRRVRRPRRGAPARSIGTTTGKYRGCTSTGTLRG